MKRIRFLNPRSDGSFIRLVEEAVVAGVGTSGELQARLRAVYPAAVVRERGLHGDIEPIWYVYRDGHWIPDPEEGKRSG